jgi:serine/threonine-protein kinase
MLGRRLGRFHILVELGRGGMGTVWKARDELLGRVVAVKVLDAALSSDVGARRGFRREAEIAAGLDHRFIVPVYEAGEFEEVAFLVMKLVEGETLERFAARRLPPPRDLLRIAAAVTEALAYAHGRDVIHRDITPRNIMVTPVGACVLDFGLARVAGASASSTSHVVGTPAYLAPERLAGRVADARSDLYGLGVVMYEALTGTRPFRGRTTDALYYNIVNGVAVPPRHLRPELDAGTDALIMRLLSRSPEDRPSSAEALAAELSCILATLGTEPASGVADTGAGASPGAPTPVPVTPREYVGGEPAPPARGLADRLASGETRTYLAMLPIEVGEAGDPTPERGRLLSDLTTAVHAGLANLEGLHVMAPDRHPAPDEDARAFARREGANLLLRSTARFAGTTARVVFTLVDPETATHIGGGSADGSLLNPFELEDRLVDAVRQALALPSTPRRSPWRAPRRDPVAGERFALALSYLHRFDNEASIDGAISLLETLLETEGESASVHAALTRAYVYKYQQTRLRSWEARAAQACERAARLDSAAPDVLLAEGELHGAAGRCDEALVRLDRALAMKPDLYEAHLARALALDGAGRAEEAESACRLAIALHAEDWRGYWGLGLILFRHGRYAEAMGPWSRVTELTPDNASGHRNLGSVLFHLDRYDDALAAFRHANEIRPHSMAFYNLGTVLFYLERYDESVEAFEKAVALAPVNPLAWGNLGNACRRAPGREARMREALERAVALMRERFDREPGQALDWTRMAGWLANLGRREEAERTLRRALEQSSNDVYCMVSAGLTFLSLGLRVEAVDWIRRAVENGYSPESLRRSPDLRALADDPEFRRILDGGLQGRAHAFTRESRQGRP